MAFDLPPPTADELAHSERLVAHIRAEIEGNGPIDFSRFMALALYAPGLGYYAAGKTKFGAGGDFVTSPELGPVFAQCLARSFAAVLRETGGDVVEIGAGSGAFAADALNALASRDALPSRYRILETSADLRERQAERIARDAPAHAARVEWLERPPAEPWRGVLFGNEVIDALPVQRFAVDERGTWIETVALRAAAGNTFVPATRAAIASEAERIAALESSAHGPWPRPYHSEYLPQLDAWFAEVASTLERGAVLFVDYGYPRAEFYLPERREGTVVCHYRHRAHADPYKLVGLQDITAFVDFTAVAEAGVAAGFELAAYVAQSQLLLASGLPEVLAESQGLDTAAQYTIASMVKRLTLPADMGERFKAIAFVRDLDPMTLPFAALDQSFRL